MMDTMAPYKWYEWSAKRSLLAHTGLAEWSFGGVLAYETARQLLAAGDLVEFLRIVQLHQLRRVRITALLFFAEHADLDIRSKMAWLVKIDSHAMTFADDSCTIESRLYDIQRDAGDVDALLLDAGNGGMIQRWSKSQQEDHRRCGC